MLRAKFFLYSHNLSQSASQNGNIMHANIRCLPLGTEPTEIPFEVPNRLNPKIQAGGHKLSLLIAL